MEYSKIVLKNRTQVNIRVWYYILHLSKFLDFVLGQTELSSLWDTLCPCWILWGNRERLQTRGSVIKSASVLWRAGCSRGQWKGVLHVSRPSAPPAGRSEQCIWLRRRRRGMLLFSSALWRSGAKIADSSSIHTGSHSTHSPECRIAAWQTLSWRERPVVRSRYSPAEAGRDTHPLHWSPYR